MKAKSLPILLLFISYFCNAQSTKIEFLDPQMKEIVSPDEKIELLGSGMIWAEGPVWVNSGGYLLFSDPRLNTIFKWDEKNGLTTFLKPSGYQGEDWYSDEPGTNGLLVNSAGKLIACDHGTRGIVKIDLHLKNRELLTDSWNGLKFNSPNDICEHPLGFYFFTDPPYGLPGRLKDTTNKQILENGVYRFDKSSGEVEQVISDLARPNGIAVSKDGDRLFVALSDDNNPFIMRYILKEGVVINEGDVFIDFDKQLPGESLRADGIKFDKNGNLFAAAGDGVVIINNLGKVIGRIRSGVHTANCAFSSDGYLYMTATDKLLRIKLKN